VDRSAILALLMLTLQPVLTSPARVTDIATCTKEQLLAFSSKCAHGHPVTARPERLAFY
jgi:hypothetical protein